MTSQYVLPPADQEAETVLAQAGVSALPVDLNRIVSLWKNLFVVEEELDGSGYLLPIGELGAEIIVNKNDRTERKRFTVAHELGHWLLGLELKDRIGKFKQPPDLPRATLEKWCDAFASNLLMPRSLLESRLPARNKPSLVDAMLEACQDFAVSEEAFFIRVWDALTIQVAYIKMADRGGGPNWFEIERSYADKKAEAELRKVLETPGVSLQLLNKMPLIFFSLHSKQGSITCVGRRIGNERMLMAVSWPTAT